MIHYDPDKELVRQEEFGVWEKIRAADESGKNQIHFTFSNQRTQAVICTKLKILGYKIAHRWDLTFAISWKISPPDQLRAA